MRILDPKWAFAMAQGRKWIEVQKYRNHNLNIMRFAKAGTWVVLGTSRRITGVAVCSGQAMRKQQDKTVFHDSCLVSADLWPDLDAYLQNSASFDWISFTSVCDLTQQTVSWDDLFAVKGATKPKCRQGFPRLGNQQLAASMCYWFPKMAGLWRSPYDRTPAD